METTLVIDGDGIPEVVALATCVTVNESLPEYEELCDGDEEIV